ncbi:MAG: protease SohB [Spongiibacteraceae bacterium]|nr:protease SohB [Spongiibacteraceae bacterium]
MEFLYDYGLFLAKAITLVLAILITVAGLVAVGMRQRQRPRLGHIEVTSLSERLEDYQETLNAANLDEHEYKALEKAERKRRKADDKARRKGGGHPQRNRVFVLEFDGDIRASAVDNLREEISAVLTVARAGDQVLVRIESGGGMVHSYGLAASQLQRVVDAGLPLIAAVDRVAASGGYMMACIANTIIAAPFALIGSIGVMAQVPNFHRLLKKHDVDVELHTAGEFKRTLTVLGENTEKGRRKFLEELEETHQLFKVHVAEHRHQVDVDRIATGEVWYGSQALALKLVDQVQTSDEWLMAQRKDHELYLVQYQQKRSWQERMGLAAEGSADRLLLRWWQRFSQRQPL